MSNNYFSVASLDNNYDVIGVFHSSSEEEYNKLCKEVHVHSVFSELKDAHREAKRLSIGRNGNGAFYVENVKGDEEYLVFRFPNDDMTFDYLTTRKSVAHALAVNQDNDIPWETVDAVLEDYENNRDVGIELYEWLSTTDIIAERDMKTIKHLKFYTGDTRKNASVSTMK